MNLPLFMPGMQNFIVICIAVLAGAAVAFYLLKYKFKHPVVRKALTIFFLIVAGVVIAYVLFYTISNFIGRSHVEARLAEMRTQGIPLDRDSVLPKMPEKYADNGAFFYKAAFEIMNVTPSCDTFNEIYCKYIDSRYAEATAEWSEQDRNTVRQIFVEENIKLIINLFRQGAAKPFAVYERQYQGSDTLLPELNPQRGLFRLINAKSFYEGLGGNPDSGYRLLCDGFKAITQFKSEPFLLSQLVNIMCTTINIGGMNELTSRYGISDSSARQILAELGKLDFNQDMIHAIDADILMWRDDVFEKLIRGEKVHCLDWLVGSSLSTDMRNMPLWGFEIWPFFYQDYAYFLERMNKIRNLFKRPYWDCSVENEMEKIVSENNHWNYRFITKRLTKKLVQFRTRTARIESEIDAAKLMLAIYIYKNRNNEFPDKLTQLAPAILKEIPVDPISGRPFEYHKTDGTFELSSVWLKEKREEEEDRKEQENRNRNKNGK